MGKKDELLQGLDLGVLLKLASSASESPVKSGAPRAELVKIIKGSLSVDEIIRKLNQEEGGSEPDRLTGAELTAGGVGQVFLAISGAISTIAYYVAITGSGTSNYYEQFALWCLASSMAVLVFAILFAVSIMKIPRELGSRVGRATSLVGTIAAIIGIIRSLSLGVSYVILSISYTWLLGTTMALLGAFFLVCRGHSASSDLWVASGIIYIVDGGYLLSITPLMGVPSASFVAAIIGAICFFTRKAPK